MEGPPPPASSVPAKKRIKLSLGSLKRRALAAAAMKLEAESATPSTVKPEEVDDVGSSSIEATAIPVVEAKHISTSVTTVDEEPQMEFDEPTQAAPIKEESDVPKKEPIERISTEGTEEGVVKATVVESDDGGDDDVVAAIVEEPVVPVKIQSSGATASTSVTGRGTRKQATTTAKAIRLPPMSSPGLLIPPGATGPFRSTADATTGLSTPASVFDLAMSMAGYSTEARKEQPHRGSSVQRVVGDMFDSDVQLTFHFPELVPEELLISRAPEGKDEAEDPTLLEGKRYEVAERLFKAFQVPAKKEQETSDAGADANYESTLASGKKGRKRKLPTFHDMAPLSLTTVYPEEYIQKRLEYLDQVDEREKAIVIYQEEELALDKEREQLELLGEPIPESLLKSSTIIPPIPEPPEPPSLKELEGFSADSYEDRHPLYLPKSRGQQQIVSHLDKSCFHITNGRYFGLRTNQVADPHFVGPNAPGLAGLNLSGGTGLATSNSGGGGALGGATLLSTPAQSGASANANAAKTKDGTKGKDTGKSKDIKVKDKTKETGKATTESSESKDGTTELSKAEGNTSVSETESKTSSGVSPSPKDVVSSEKAVKSASNLTPTKKSSSGTPGSSGKKKTNGPSATATASDLRKIVEEGGELAEKMRTCIIRAAVYASRCGNHTRNFRAPNGKVYPDISKAFAVHAGLKPCERCKNNKQGAYHCRLRRKHKELDYDGGDSPGKLAPLFDVPMEELIIRNTKKVSHKPST